jgi:HK97 family phage major capsid protein
METPKMHEEHLKNLRDRRNATWHQAQALLDRAGRAKRDFTPPEEAEWRRMNDEIDLDDITIREAQERETREKESATAREAYAHIRTDANVGPTVDPHRVTTGERESAALREFLTGRGEQHLNVNVSAVMDEKKAIRAGADTRELRSILQEDVTALGGAVVPTSFSRRLVDWLEFYSGARRLDVSHYVTPDGSALTIPVVSSHGTATLTGEGTALAENDATFSNVTLHAWKYGSLTQVSSEMIADSGVDLLAFVAQDVARQIGRATDIGYTSGNGTAQPTGIMPSFGIGGTAQTLSTGIPSFANLIDLQYSIAPAYRQRGAQWFGHNTSFAKLRKVVDSTGRPMWSPSMEQGEPDRLLGSECVMGPNVSAFSTAATTHSLAFGWFGGFAIRDAGSISLLRSDDFSFSQDLVTFRGLLRTDSAVIDSHSVKVMLEPTT